MVATQRKLVRQAIKQAANMKINGNEYLKSSSYQNRPVVLTKDGANNIHITTANKAGGGTVTTHINTQMGKVLTTSRVSHNADKRIYGTTDNFKISGKATKSAKKPSTGHSGG